VSAAASVVTASWKRRDLVRLITTDNTDFGFAAGTAHAEAIMEFLATVGASAGGSLRGVLEALGLAGNGGAIVAVVAGVADAEIAAIARLRRRFGSVTIVQFSSSSGDDAPPAVTATRDSATIVRVGRDASFADAWNLAIQRRRRGTVVNW
jgi:hypothetical protein